MVGLPLWVKVPYFLKNMTSDLQIHCSFDIHIKNDWNSENISYSTSQLLKLLYSVTLYLHNTDVQLCLLMISLVPQQDFSFSVCS